MFWRDQGAGGEAIVRFTGVLDAASARGVEPFLSVGPSGKVVLDLSQATDLDYYGLWALVSEILRSGAAVVVRGLHENHVRMLRYFGLDPGKFGITGIPCSDVG